VFPVTLAPLVLNQARPTRSTASSDPVWPGLRRLAAQVTSYDHGFS